MYSLFGLANPNKIEQKKHHSVNEVMLTFYYLAKVWLPIFVVTLRERIQSLVDVLGL